MARIRNAALQRFARDGVGGTTIRDVARSAGVSAGLVQHHFKTKADLERAVNEYILQIAVESSEGLEEATAGVGTEELLLAMGERISELVRDHRDALLHVIRSAANGEKAGLDIFDAFLALVDKHVERLVEEGALREDVDRLWLGLQVVILDLGTVFLEPAINRHLSAPLLAPDQLDRWRTACNELLCKGLVKP